MRKIVAVLLLFCFVISVNAQELNGLVTINSDKISGSNKQVYATLQTALTEFINQTKWTEKNFKTQEKINCAFTITVNAQPATNRFEASIQVQAVRPVYTTSYTSPIVNIKDNHLNFKYTEFEPLYYNTTSFESNLVSTIAYYVYVILGIDADTFALHGGNSYFKQAKDVLLLAQQSGGSGWIDQIGKQNRYALIDHLTSSKLAAFKNIMYNYHRKGMDVLSTDTSKAKKMIENSVLQLESLHNKTMGNYLIRSFFDAKADEIATLFSDGPKTPKSKELKELLQRISPTNNAKWRKMK
ncbi:MAG: DUF4835 family protein [Polaribacter sp.]|nr:DUF4835 family protein [Polaribacter sp.]